MVLVSIRRVVAQLAGHSGWGLMVDGRALQAAQRLRWPLQGIVEMDEDDGIAFIPSLVVIIALALVLFVFLGLTAYRVLLFAMWLIESAASFGLVW
jgi:hypothetical protein